MDRFLQAHCVPFLDGNAGLFQAPPERVESRWGTWWISCAAVWVPRTLRAPMMEKESDSMLPPSVYERLGLARVREKVLAGERLNLEEGLRLLECPDLLAVGALAHQVRTRLHGPTTYYVVNQHINYSNICVNGCRFCAFARERGRPGAFELSVEEILQKVRERLHDPITEIHIVGGCHPDLRLDTFERLLREIRRIRPGVRLKAFTAVEIDHFARLEGISTRAVLERLKAAGLDMLPGGGRRSSARASDACSVRTS